MKKNIHKTIRSLQMKKKKKRGRKVRVGGNTSPSVYKVQVYNTYIEHIT